MSSRAQPARPPVVVNLGIEGISRFNGARGDDAAQMMAPRSAPSPSAARVKPAPAVRAPAYDPQPEPSFDPYGGISDADFDEMVRREMEQLELQARSQMEPKGRSMANPPAAQRGQRYEDYEVEVPASQPLRSGRSEAALSARQDKVSRQQEYARQLLKDAEIKARGPVKSAGGDDSSRPRRAAVDDERRRKDAIVNEMDEGGLRFGERSKPVAKQPNSEREAQLQKQREYAMLLQKDMSMKATVVADETSKIDSPVKKHSVNRNKNRFDADDGASTGLQIGHGMDKASEREAKRRSQEEYAAQLRQGAAQQHQMASSSDAPSSGRRRRLTEQSNDGEGYTSLQLSGYDINTSQRVQNKRTQQQDYYYDLKEVEAQQPVRSAYDEKKDRLMSEGNRTSLMLPGNDISTVQKRSSNVAAQHKYSRELDEQIHGQHSAQDPYRDRVSLRKHAPDAEDEDHPLGAPRGSVEGLIGKQYDQEEAKQKKKIAQRDYARQLALDSNTYSRMPSAEDEVAPRVGSSGRRSSGQQQQKSSPDKKKRPDELLDARRFAARALSLDEENLGATVFSSAYSKDKHNVEQFQTAPNTKAAEYKDRQRAYADMLAQDSAMRDTLREEAGHPGAPSNFNAARQRAASTGRARPSAATDGEAEGTGLMIGGMDVSTSLRLQQKKESQAKYARDIAAAASVPSIPSSYRSTIQERREHEMSGLPLPGNNRRAAPAADDYYSMGGGGRYVEEEPTLYGKAPAYRGAAGPSRDDYRTRGTSTGGGQSTFSLY